MTGDENEIVWDDGDAERREVLKVARDKIAALHFSGDAYYDLGYGDCRTEAIAIIDALIANPNA